ncbi:MAG: S-layer homology domain-containing protein [Clostridia bacterium]|nr:S-layer homology domain-containing protein [Clostridia bacterium]
MTMKKITAFVLSFIVLISVSGFNPLTADAAPDKEAYYKMSIAEYDNFSYSDPQYITDEDFFGKWNEETQEWEKVPYFIYGPEIEEQTDAGQKLVDIAVDLEGLERVEDAARLGNYQLCKEELLKYYQKKHKDYNMDPAPNDYMTDADTANYEGWFDNLYGGNPFAKAYVYDNWQEIKISVLSNMKEQAVYNRESIKLMLGTGRKDGYRIEIDLENHEPYIKAEINGEQRTFPLTTAVNLDFGEPDTPHPNPNMLYIEESVSSIGSPTTVDENTKRALMQFNIPDVSSTSQINGATLYIRARRVEDDLDIESPLVQNDWKYINLYGWNAENNLNVNMTVNDHFKQGLTFRSFSGESGPRDFYATPDAPKRTAAATFGYIGSSSHKGNWYGETFQYHSIRSLLNSIINRGNWETFYDDTQQGLSNFNALGVASVSFNGAHYLHHVMESKYMTPEAFTMILKYIYFIGRWLEEYWGDAFELVNHGGYSVSGQQWINFLYPEFRDVYGPLERDAKGNLVLSNPKYGGSVCGGWLEVASFRMAYKQGADINPDGSSVEASAEYALEGMDGYLSALRVGDSLNYDTSFAYDTEWTEEANARLGKGLEYIVNTLNPRFGGFQTGDDASWTYDFPGRLETYTRIIDNPYLNYVVSKRKEGEAPPLSVAYDDASVATFRNSWANEYAIAASFLNRGGGSHNHNDDLTINLVAYNNFLLVDPLMGDYNTATPLERWVSSTRGHNTIEIDNAVARGRRTYAEQMDEIVFSRDENGLPAIGDEGVAMIDDPLIVPIAQMDPGKGDLFPENREFNNVYDYIKGSSKGYTDNAAPVLENESFQLERDILFLRDGYFIVSDYAEPEYYKQNNKEHLYKQLWHFLPDAKMSVDYEKNILRTNFQDKANVIVATVDDGNIEPVWKYGAYARTKNNFEVCKYGFFKQTKVGPMKFNTIIYPIPERENAEVTTKNIELDQPEDKASAFRAEVTSNGVKKEIYYYTLRDENLKKDITFGTFSTDGMLSLIEKEDGKNANLVLRSGSYVRDEKTNEYIFLSKDEVTDFGAFWQNDEIDLAYDADDIYNEDIDLSKITLMAEGEVSKVRLNGEEIEFKQQGKYIYFGNEPLIEDEVNLPEEDTDEEDTDEEEEEEDTPVHGGGTTSGLGGSSGGGGGSNKEEKPTTPPKEPEKPLSDAFSEELSNHWGEEEIKILINDGVVKGDDKGKLNLKNPVTRAELLTMLIRAMKIDEKEYESEFSDVKAEDWYASAVATAKKIGLAEGDGTSVMPNAPVTREQMAKFLVTAYILLDKNVEEKESITFTDSEDISQWAKTYIDKATSVGILNGMGDGSFAPKSTVLREQAFAAIGRLIR